MHGENAILYGSDNGVSPPHLVKYRNLPVRLHRTREALMLLFRETFQQYDLTDPQWRVLRILSTVEEIDTAALAQRTLLLGPSLSRILRDLHARNLVNRVVSATDARRSFHSLTPQAWKLIDTIVPQFDPIYQAVSEQITEDEINSLNALLDKVGDAIRNLNVAAASDGAPPNQ